MTCKICGINEEVREGVCDSCLQEAVDDLVKLESLEVIGHTPHCCARLVWGDGECECGKEKIKKESV